MKKSKSYCPMNQALEVFGDKWTLLIIRDIMFDDKRNFNDIRESEEKIASNILADRLVKLEEFGIIIKTNDINHKQKYVYTLTQCGIDLVPVMIEIAKWSSKYRVVSEKDKKHVAHLAKGGKTLQSKMKNELLGKLKGVTKK